jgi:hypothetical protein
MRPQQRRFRPKGDAIVAKNVTSRAEPESTSGYFRRVFKENPQWIKASNNQEVMDRWLADHPGDREVPQKAKYILSNVKSKLRSMRRRNNAANEAPIATANSSIPVAVPRKVLKGLEHLEASIDDCLAEAKRLDRAALHEVISLLRSARNAVVWKGGES